MFSPQIMQCGYSSELPYVIIKVPQSHKSSFVKMTNGRRFAAVSL
jgi:hypothetical protein